MLKFNRANTHDLYASKQKRQRLVGGQSQSLESPKNISLESLQALADQENVVPDLEPPPRVSLSSLRKLIASSSSKSANNTANAIFHVSTSSLENLQLLVEGSSQLIHQDARIITRNLLTSNNSVGNGKLRVWKIEAEEDRVTSPVEAEPEATPVAASVPVETVSKPALMIERLKELSENPESLEKWLASLNLPKEMDIPVIRIKIQEFLRNKSWEKHYAGHIRDVTKDSLAERLWNGFKEMSVAKQILVIIGLSIVIAAVGFLTIQFLSLLWPSVLGLASSGEAAIVEIGVEAFKQRQEPAFHLLLSHAEQAKPMSYAWANQYILWKYIR